MAGRTERGPSSFVKLPDDTTGMIVGRSRDTGYWRVLPGFEAAGRPPIDVPDGDCGKARRTDPRLVEFWESLPEALIGSEMHAAIRQRVYIDAAQHEFIGHLAFGHNFAREYEPGMRPLEPRDCPRCSRR